MVSKDKYLGSCEIERCILTPLWMRVTLAFHVAGGSLAFVLVPIVVDSEGGERTGMDCFPGSDGGPAASLGGCGCCYGDRRSSNGVNNGLLQEEVRAQGADGNSVSGMKRYRR